MNFPRSGVILILIIIISSSTSTAQTMGECKESIPCFNPDLSLGVGDIFHWDVTGQNISEQIDTFEWRDLRLTHIELEITEDIRGLSTSVGRNFAKYFKLIYTLDGNDIDIASYLQEYIWPIAELYLIYYHIHISWIILVSSAMCL